MSIAQAVLIVLAGGAMQGSFLVPARATRRWAWENYWLLYAVAGTLVLPWALALATVPDIGGTLTSAGWRAVGVVFLFGLGWGMGSVLFGLGVDAVGMAVGFSVILGLTTAIGMGGPLLATPEKIATPAGRLTLAGAAILIAGVVVVSLAGRARERTGGSADRPPGRFGLGIVLCVLSGVLSPMLNLAYAYGTPLQDAAKACEAAAPSDIVWAVALTGGFLPNAIWTGRLLARNRTWLGFSPRAVPPWYWPCGLALGAIWYGGLALYGRGTGALGDLGKSLGWGIFMASIILASNLWGAVFGEWKGAVPRARRLLLAGVGVLAAGIAVLAVAAGSD